MRKQLMIKIVSVIAVLTAAVTTKADYSNTVVSLKPVAYWPLNETVQPPAAYVATNSGSLGAAGNGFYETWFNPSGNGYVAQMDWTGPVPGATSDGDGAASFRGNGNRYIQIPHTSPGTVIQAPFSVECWTYATNVSDFENLVGAGGQNGRNVDANGNWAGFSLGLYNGNWIFDLYNTNGNSGSIELQASATTGQWYHLVATYDGTNAIFYANGSEVATGVPNANSAGLGYVPDPINPILLGRLNPPHSGDAYSGLIDEVAIYTNILSSADVANHYSAATAGGYSAAVIANNPLIYLRLDEPLYTLPPSNTFASFPQAQNYGSIGSGANGLYQPGTLPGMPGPTGIGFGSANYSVAINGMDAGVDVGNGNLTGVAPALNVTGTNALSVVAWFKGNPADGYNRFQSILGHGDSGWRFGFGGSGPQFNPGGGGEIASSDSYNDGRWHMAAGIYDGRTNYLYIDGALVNKTSYSGSQSSSSLDVLLGGAPDYTTPSGRYWSGSLAQVSFFTNAISAANVLQLYSDAGIIPFISQQPVSATVNGGEAYTSSAVIGGSLLSYQWYQNGVLVVGQTNENLAYNPAQGSDAGNYFVVATNNGGSVTSSVITLTVNTSPQVTQQSGTNYILFTGGSATFSVTAIGAVPLYYYWSSNGVSITDATNSTYTLTNAQIGTSYACLVSNFLGSTTGSVISVSVIPVTNNYPQAVLADNPISYWRMDEPDQGYPNNGVVAHDYWGGHNGSYTNTELGFAGYPAIPDDPDTAAQFGNLVSSDGDSDMQASGIDFATANGGNAEFSIETWVNAASGGQIADGSGIITKGSGSGGEQFNLDTGNGGAFRFFVRDAGGGVHLANSSIMPDGNWHHLVGVCDEAKGSLSLYVDGTLAGSGSIVPASGLLTSASSVSIGARQSQPTGSYDDQLAGIVDEVAIFNYALSPAQVAIHYDAAGSYPPTIIQQPTNITVNAGTTATFSAVVTGTPPFSYQWYDVTAGSPGTPISGANSATLTLDNVSAAQNGNLYALVVTNVNNQVTTTPAQLTVLAGPPTLQTDLQPLFAKAFIGTPITFSVVVGGTPPFHYQWNQDGTPVGANANTYTATVIAGTNTYSCQITNADGSIVSSTATLIGVAVTDTGTNSETSSTTFAINFMDAANSVYSPDGVNSFNQAFEGLGAYPDDAANTNWNGFGQFPNGFTPTFNSAIAPQAASDGTLTPITLSLTYASDNGAIGYGPGGGNTAQGAPSFILGNAAIVSGTTLGTITFSNVPQGIYTLYLYGANFDGTRGATFNFTTGSALGGTNATQNTYTNGGSGPLTSFVYGMDYVIFNNVTPDANGTITGTWGAVSNNGNTGEGDFNGLQLVRVSGSATTLPTVSISLSGANAIISWNPTNGTLQSASVVTGPYSDISGSTSPYTNSITGTQQFFRVKVQ